MWKHPNKREKIYIYRSPFSMYIVCRSICMFRSLLFFVCVLCKIYSSMEEIKMYIWSQHLCMCISYHVRPCVCMYAFAMLTKIHTTLMLILFHIYFIYNFICVVFETCITWPTIYLFIPRNKHNLLHFLKRVNVHRLKYHIYIYYITRDSN